MPKVATGILQPARISKAESTGPTPVLSFRYLLLIGQSLLLICQTLLLALDEGLKEFRMFFLQVANLLQ
jgi:hypothetical protein